MYDCITCDNTIYQITDEFSGGKYCKKICNSDQYWTDENTNTCEPCNEECLTCVGPNNTDCTSCKSDYLSFYRTSTGKGSICIKKCDINSGVYHSLDVNDNQCKSKKSSW